MERWTENLRERQREDNTLLHKDKGLREREGREGRREIEGKLELDLNKNTLILTRKHR